MKPLCEKTRPLESAQKRLVLLLRFSVGSLTDALHEFQLHSNPGRHRGNALMSRLPERFHCTALSIHCKWFAPEYYLGVFTVSYWKPQSALYFFLFLFKANGSESEQPAVTQAEIHDDLENTQMEKGCFCQPCGMAVHTLWAQNMPHPGVSIHRN